ncbi:MAG TPA: DUF4240 domain-containing protein [Pirellulaceae bacterium]|nr:DUF4240 domain-containing protein [Pirellulaceae bacterium]
MNTNEFWKIIDKSRRGAESDEEQAEKLQAILSTLPAEEIRAFDKIFTELRFAAYHWDIWGVAYILCGGCGDDGFDYFRAWLIGRGQKVYEAALADAQSIAKKVTEDDLPEAEMLMYAASQAYTAKTGNELPANKLKHPKKPAGKKWQEDDLEKRFPIAYKKEGICG